MDVPNNNELFTPEYIQSRMTIQMAKGLRLASYLNRDQVDSQGVYTYFQDATTAAEDLESGVMGAPERIAPGAEYTPIRATDISGKSLPVETRGFKIEVDNQKLKQNGSSILRFMGRLAYGIGQSIENDVATALVNGAGATTASINDGVWSASSKINEDIREMQKNFKDYSLGEKLNFLAYELDNFEELRGFYEATTGNDADDPDQLNYKGALHIDGGEAMTHGTTIGFDRTSPPATVAYGVLDSAFNPKVLNGMEGYAPLINVKVDEDLRGLPEKTVIYMGAETAVAVEEPKALLAQTGL